MWPNLATSALASYTMVFFASSPLSFFPKILSSFWRFTKLVDFNAKDQMGGVKGRQKGSKNAKASQRGKRGDVKVNERKRSGDD